MREIVLTLQEAFQLWPALGELVEGPIEDGKRLAAERIPAKAAHQLGKIYRKLQPVINDFEKKRMDLFKRLGDYNEETDNWTIKAENMDEFTKEMEACQAEDITVKGVTQIAFDDIEHLDFKPGSILALEPLISDLE